MLSYICTCTKNSANNTSNIHHSQFANTTDYKASSSAGPFLKGKIKKMNIHHHWLTQNQSSWGWVNTKIEFVFWSELNLITVDFSSRIHTRNAFICSSGLCRSCCIQISIWIANALCMWDFTTEIPESMCCTAAAWETTVSVTCNVHLAFPLPALNSCPKLVK